MKRLISGCWINNEQTIITVWNHKEIIGELHVVAGADELAFTKKEIQKGWKTTAVSVTTCKGNRILVRPVKWVGTPLTKEIAQEAIDDANQFEKDWERMVRMQPNSKTFGF